MYRSGPWRGWWEQLEWGRQPMGDLVLRFANGEIEGEGHDIIGPFVFTGSYDDRGNLTMTKQYTGRMRHSVFYNGSYDGEGTILGTWSIGELWRGPFALSPIPGQPGVSRPAQEIKPR